MSKREKALISLALIFNLELLSVYGFLVSETTLPKILAVLVLIWCQYLAIRTYRIYTNTKR